MIPGQAFTNGAPGSHRSDDPTAGNARMVKPIRLVYIIQNLNYGGMERVLHGLASQLPSRGFDVHVVALEYLGRFAHGLPSATTLHNPPPMGRLSLLHPGALAGLLRSLAPDIVHSHTGVWLKAARAARLARVPVVLHTEHGRPAPIPLADRLIDHLASRSTDLVVAVSDALAALLRAQVLSSRTPIRTIHNGVDIVHFGPLPPGRSLRAALRIPEDAWVVGSIGRLEPVKNYSLALRAFARLAQRTSDRPAFFLLAGDGSERPGLERLAGELGVSDRVRFLGWQDDAAAVYGALDLFTLTSDSEGTSVSLLEAMSMGICPVVTDVGGNRTVLGPELATHLVPPGLPEPLSELWHRLLRDRAVRERAAGTARARVARSFSLTSMVEEHVRLYRELLQATPMALAASGPRTVHEP